MKAASHDLCALIHLPDSALRQHIAILGKTGSGKTFTAKGIVEKLLSAGRRVCIIDPTGAWWGLRSSADGEKAGFEVVILGGTHGDAPLPALSGAACAELVVSGNVQVVFDTSAMTVGDRTRWFIDFGTALYRLNSQPLHLIIDEAHVFAPQGKVPDPETGKMLHAANALASGGRSRGIRLVMLTQRPAKLHKDSLTCCDTLIAMRVIAPQDREAIEDWVLGCGDKVKGKQVLDSLAQLSKGEGWVWFPEGGVLERVKFPRITTFDSSATPEDGSDVPAPKRRAEIDLASIQATMADELKQAKDNDPKRLWKRIAELEEQVNAKYWEGIREENGTLRARVKKHDEELQRARDEHANDYAALSFWRQTAREAHSTLDLAFKLEDEKKGRSDGREADSGVGRELSSLPTGVARFGRHLPEGGRTTQETRVGAMNVPHRNGQTGSAVGVRKLPVGGSQKHTARAQGQSSGAESDMPVGERTVLAALIQYPNGLSRRQLVTITGYSMSSIKTYLPGLTTRGYVVCDRGQVCKTDAGEAAMPDAQPLPTGAALREHHLRTLPEGEGKILRAVIDAWPNQVSRAELVESTGFSLSTVKTYLPNLTNKELVTCGRGAVRASDTLFEEGMR